MNRAGAKDERAEQPPKDSSPPRIVIICGPTASGKTALGVRLAELVGGELVGADSLQVYRQLHVGTAKPTADERARVPYHLVDIIDPDEPFNAALFKEMADVAIDGIRERNKVPIVVGGTGLYLRILVRGIFEAPRPDQSLRKSLKLEIDAYGIEQLYKRLELVDPRLASKVEPHDRNRIIRGLEIYEQTGIPLSEHQLAHDFGEASYEALSIGVKLKREVLYRRIAARTEQMMKDGLLQEYKGLVGKGYDADLKPMQSLGYRQMGDYIEGRLTKEQAVAAITKETKRYAKRQLTWFRKEDDIMWVERAEQKLPGLAADVRRFMTGEPLELDWVSEPP